MVSHETRLGHISVAAERAGSPAELSQMLLDFDAAYCAVYRFQAHFSPLHRRRRGPMMFELAMEFGYPWGPLGWGGSCGDLASGISPEHQLVVSKVRIESPGLWEFLGSLNPLQQVREYLNDRHRRRQDKEFREASERDRLILENELIQTQINEKDNANLRERIALFRELGMSDEEIRAMVWTSIGKPLAQLGRHQDSRLIGNSPD